ARVVHRPAGGRGSRRRDLGRVEQSRVDVPRRAGEGELMPALPRVLIIDDHKLFGEVIRSTLEGMDLDVVDVVSSAREGLDAARRHRPDLVLVDIGLPDESGLSVGATLVEE